MENSALPLPLEQLTLADLREAVKGRFSSFCTAVGIQSLMILMEQDVAAVAGPKGKHDPNRAAYRHGSQATTIPMVNQRLAIERPRVRSTRPSAEELAVATNSIESAFSRVSKNIKNMKNWKNGTMVQRGCWQRYLTRRIAPTVSRLPFHEHLDHRNSAVNNRC